MRLTTRKIEVLDFITEFIRKNQYSPTVREIGAGLYMSSPATVFTHITDLETLGYITQVKGKNRTIKVVKKY